jgi:Asp-tRNA(Asn)/Glu-tRNA(Gln) amidotransferase A subunit family amidase
MFAMFDVIAGADRNDATTLRERAPNTRAALEAPIAGLRVGIDRRFALEGIGPGQAASIEQALRVLDRETHDVV